MKSNTVVLLVIVLVVVNVIAIQAWPFGFRSGIQGFKNMRVGKQGFQNMTPPAMRPKHCTGWSKPIWRWAFPKKR